MERPSYRQNFDRRSDTKRSHQVTWDLTVPSLARLSSWPFKKTYRTLCEIRPTTWTFDLALPEVRDDGTITMSIALKRTDDTNHRVEGAFQVDICDPSVNIYDKNIELDYVDYRIYPRQVSLRSMLPGESIERTVELFPEVRMGRFVRGKVVVYVTLLISYCHSSPAED